MNTSKKADFTVSVCHIERFSKSKYRFGLLKSAGRIIIIRIQTIAKQGSYEFNANAINITPNK